MKPLNTLSGAQLQLDSIEVHACVPFKVGLRPSQSLHALQTREMRKGSRQPQNARGLSADKTMI